MAVSKPLLGLLDKGLAITEAKNEDIVILSKSVYICLKEWLHIMKLIGAKLVTTSRLTKIHFAMWIELEVVMG